MRGFFGLVATGLIAFASTANPSSSPATAPFYLDSARQFHINVPTKKIHRLTAPCAGGEQLTAEWTHDGGSSTAQLTRFQFAPSLTESEVNRLRRFLAVLPGDFYVSVACYQNVADLSFISTTSGPRKSVRVGWTGQEFLLIGGQGFTADEIAALKAI